MTKLVLQEVVRIPKMVNFMGLDGERVIQLPTNAKITVKSNQGNVYQVPITNKTHYNPEELMNRESKFNAQVDTDKWVVHSIIKETPYHERSLGEEQEEYSELGGDY
jgi:hypothetical protein